MAEPTKDESKDKDSKQVEKELDGLETALAELKREYEIFFAGGSKQLPLDMQRRVERVIKRYSVMTGLSYAHRFRLNSLVARFNSYLDLWNKQMRYKEEGRTPSGAMPPVPNGKQKEKTPASPQDRKLESLFNEYLKKRQETGEGAPKLNFQGFCELVNKQRETIVQKYNCKDVDFYVKVEEGHARLKARPVR